ncbi:1-phosphofructokinase family hexose kinase [Kutzneria albida]|uniref:Sugar kinase n=1 Tax=Kutzneria albida DSM 43870 TaxID=1449976 RepID=W5W2T3_9PSEU|nr:1-phosphofructokinase family hexose kinase [Kutzneria albida]AHH95503.1 sugar kinase [Kutzneria albida DSM 43870]
MILTVTLNTALDVTYEVDGLRPHCSHRVRTVRGRAGGKGVNVARVLTALGHSTQVTGLVGGPTGELVRADLAASGLADRLHQVAGDTRRTVTVVAGDVGDATVFNEPGPRVGEREWAEFLAHYRESVRGAQAVVLSGSVPPGVPVTCYHDLIRVAAARGVPTVLDTSGAPLLAALPAHPDLVKPNAAELSEVTRVANTGQAAERLREAGAGAVVASLGPDGLLAVTGQGRWRAVPGEHLLGNPTGAGDACVAALAAALAQAHDVSSVDWPRALTEAVAVSAAAVAAPLAGEYDDSVRERLLATVHVDGTSLS